MRELKYRFEIPIGDWSDDGHGKCDYFAVSSSHSVEDVREFYFNACEKAGYKFEDAFCAEYEDSHILEEQLESTPLPFDISEYKEEYENIFRYYNTEYAWHYVFSPKQFAELLLKWIKYYNPEFEYKFDEDLPMLPFYGYDENGRHIGFFGYGLFE